MFIYKKTILSLLLVAFLLVVSACADVDPILFGEGDGFVTDEVQALEEAGIEGDDEVQESVVIVPEAPADETDLEPAAEITGDFQEAPDWLIRAFYLLEMGVDNLADEDIGEVEDLVVDIASGEIVYVIIEYGGILDIGDAEKPLPPSAFAWEDTDDLVLLVDEETLADVPSVPDDWPTDTDPILVEDVQTYWGESGLLVDPTVDLERPLVRAQDVIGYPVGDVGIGTGSVEDLLVYLPSGRVRYVVLNYITSGYGEMIVVPIEVFNVETLGDQFVFDTEFTSDLLTEAPIIESEAFQPAQLLEPGLEGEIVTYWGQRGYPVEVERE